MQSHITPIKIETSILIRTKNEGRSLEKTLSVLFSQSLKDFEIIIVDSGSTDNTLEIAERYSLRIFNIKPEDFTWGYALNYGFQHARGKFVVCLSAHALPSSDKWLEALIANFQDEKVAAVASSMLPLPDCNPFDRRGLLKRVDMKKQELLSGPPYMFSNSSSAIRKDVWEEIRFDETLLAVEEEAWARHVRKAGYKIMYEPDARVYHSHNESLKKIYKRFYDLAHAWFMLGFEKYSMTGIMYDFIVGSAYDMLYVLYKRDNLKWFFIAPLRRFSMNLAKYNVLRDIRAKKSC